MLVTKRNNERVEFDQTKIELAVEKAMISVISKTEKSIDTKKTKETSLTIATEVRHRLGNINFVDIELIQDTVEEVLMDLDHHQVAKAYILYRENHKTIREKSNTTSAKLALLGARANMTESQDTRLEVLAAASAAQFNNEPIRQFVYKRTYARWIKELGRREFWQETVTRFLNFIKSKCGDKLSDQDYHDIFDAIFEMKVSASMRLLQFAGPAADRCNVCIYNCSFSTPSTFKDFADILYLSCSGVGVGFSCEKVNVDLLPEIQPEKPNTIFEYIIEDTKEGWADALEFCMEKSFEGAVVDFDYSSLRPKGARCYTSGGRSSGPGPLKELLKFVSNLINERRATGNTKLSCLNVHDIVCKIGEAIAAGGTRRSALISISDLDDQDMRGCKNGPIWQTNPQRYMSNNSAAYNVKPPQVVFMKEWLALIESKNGERGIVNRSNLDKILPQRRVDFLGDKIKHMGTNPCSEVVLQPFQFCNLTEVICRSDDTEESLNEKIRVASMIGTIQSSLSDFKYIDPKWKKNQDDERLLGVSLTGIYDCPILDTPGILTSLKEKTIATNIEYAAKLGINASTATTSIKPSGSVSQMVNSASGIHPRFSKFYIRRIRISANDPLLAMMRSQGYEAVPEVGQTEENASTFVLSFPVKSPENAITVDQVSSLQQLEHWKKYKKEFVEHSISITVYVKPDEWIQTAKFVWDNWNDIIGLSFLPYDDHIYELAPYENITEDEYNKMISVAPHNKGIDFLKLLDFEKEDQTDIKKTVACSGGLCDLI
tara:strand:+ start:6691 stop:9009 length:2319 start_codon:yes stop_codon:yes gene_type:complete